MSRYATEEEIKFMKKLERLIKTMPKTMSLHADGSLNAVDSKELSKMHELEHFQPLRGTPSVGNVDGGDCWK